jgi:hypothetical protein
MQHSSEPWKADEAWSRIRRGWCFGGSGFRKEMTGKHFAAGWFLWFNAVFFLNA